MIILRDDSLRSASSHCSGTSLPRKPGFLSTAEFLQWEVNHTVDVFAPAGPDAVCVLQCGCSISFIKSSLTGRQTFGSDRTHDRQKRLLDISLENNLFRQMYFPRAHYD